MILFSFIFPGQGSQSVGMLKALSEHSPLVNDTFSEASDILRYDLWDMCQNDSSERLSLTEFTQPALLAAGVAVWRVWVSETELRPISMAGHSLGEFTALVCAGALPYAEGIKLVRDRATYMQQAVPQGIGGMAVVIGLGDAAVRDACTKYSGSEVLQAVNYNAPGQVVVAGHAAAIQRLAKEARAIGAKRVLPLPISVPSHSELMKSAAEMLEERLKTVPIGVTKVPVYHNVDYAPAKEAALIKTKLVQQLYSPVRWVESIGAMQKSGADSFVESGPDKVLGGLLKRIDRKLSPFSIDKPDAMKACIEDLSLVKD